MDKPPFFLYVIVTVSGAVVLSLEILGTRILGPQFGVSLFLWSALISVALAALSAGYLAGGAMADRAPSARRLAALLAIAGLWITAIPWMRPAVAGLTGGWELRAAVLGSSVALFFFPLAVLGAVTPYAIRLSLREVAQAGRTSGRLFAVSTMASVGSALLTGFWLVPNLGVTLLTSLLGGILLATAGLGLLFFRESGPSRVPAMLLLILLSAAGPALSPAERPDPASGLLAVEQSPYGEIRVFDNAEGRHLMIDGGIHTRIDTATGRSTIFYSALMELPMRYFPRPGRMLLVGVGGGALVRSYRDAGWKVDAVEIDDVVIRTAREYFGLDPAAGTIVAGDGRRFLAETRERYDVVLVDAFGSGAVPFHLVSAEAFALAKGCLNDGGVFAINLITLGWHDRLVEDVAATARTAFRDVVALPMAEPPDRVGNLILLAGDRNLEALSEPQGNLDLNPDWRYGSGYAVVHAWDNRFRTDTDAGRVFTDDLNPVDVVSQPAVLAERREVLEYHARLGLAW